MEQTKSQMHNCILPQYLVISDSTVWIYFFFSSITMNPFLHTSGGRAQNYHRYRNQGLGVPPPVPHPLAGVFNPANPFNLPLPAPLPHLTNSIPVVSPCGGVTIDCSTLPPNFAQGFHDFCLNYPYLMIWCPVWCNIPFTQLFANIAVLLTRVRDIRPDVTVVKNKGFNQQNKC